MFKKTAIALAFVGALAMGGLALSSDAQAGGCGYRGGFHHHHASHFGGYGGWGYPSYYGNYGIRRSTLYYGYPQGFGGYYYAPRHSGFSFSIGF